MKYLFLIFTFISPLLGLAQSANAPLSEAYYHWVDRWEIRSGVQQNLFHTSVKPYQRKFIGEYLDRVDSLELPSLERNVLEYLKRDNWEWVTDVDFESEKAILKYFYRAKSDFYHVDTENFDLHVNPILHLSYGKDTDTDYSTYTNTRGIRLRGVIDEKVAFFTSLTENQVRFPYYIDQRIEETDVVPHVGFYKPFKENGYDYFDARGYISFNATKHINLQMGHDNFKIGNGYRSMLLSDFSPAYFFIKMETRVWKLNYTNLYTEMTAEATPSTSSAAGFPDKYGVFHHLSLDIGKKLNVGIFEAVMIGGEAGDDAELEIEYLNPIIFYRAIEQQNGSSYNALVGADFQYLPFKGISLYGQIIFDEFLLENLRSGDGWWANKFGLQLGGEWINALKIPMLDLQAEVNLARPYTYSHSTIGNSYTNYLQPLAHPFGANFNELLFIIRYQPVKNLFAELRLINATLGLDPDGMNYGGNILKDYNTRVNDFGNEIGQGVSQDLQMAVFQASYMLKHNLFIDGSITIRKSEAGVPEYNNNSAWISGGLRWNIFPGTYDF